MIPAINQTRKISASVFIDIFLLLAVGILLYLPFSDFAGPISQSDNGVDLYAIQQTFNGKIPYRDFSWWYGPILPYYGALFFKLFGADIQSWVLARLGARLLSGIVLYLAARIIISRPLAFLTTVWFWCFYTEFTHTANHALAISFFVMVCCASLYYRQRQQYKFLWFGLFAAFLLTLTKLTTGVVSLAAIIAAHGLINFFNNKGLNRQQIIFYATALLGVPLAVAFVYWLMLHPLPSYVVVQAFPLWASSLLINVPWATSFMDFFSRIFANYLTYPWHAAFGTLVLIAAGKLAWSWSTNRLEKNFKKELITTLLLIGLFYAAAMHEYIGNGFYYRALWAKPFTVLLFFVLIDRAFAQTRFNRWIITGLVVFILAGQAYGRVSLMELKTAGLYLKGPRANVYVYNRPDWINTVEDTTAFLENHLRPDETFFAFPNDSLYYFLTGRSSPNRQVYFSRASRIPPEQEADVIRSLEQQQVRWIALSNVVLANETGHDVWGKDYCPMLKKYFEDNYRETAQFGEWTNDARWSWNHAMKILERKNAFPD